MTIPNQTGGHHGQGDLAPTSQINWTRIWSRIFVSLQPRPTTQRQPIPS